MLAFAVEFDRRPNRIGTAKSASRELLWRCWVIPDGLSASTSESAQRHFTDSLPALCECMGPFQVLNVDWAEGLRLG